MNTENVQSPGKVLAISEPLRFYNYTLARKFLNEYGVDDATLLRMLAAGQVLLKFDVMIDGEIVTLGQGVGHA